MEIRRIPSRNPLYWKWMSRCHRVKEDGREWTIFRKKSIRSTRIRPKFAKRLSANNIWTIGIGMSWFFCPICMFFSNLLERTPSQMDHEDDKDSREDGHGKHQFTADHRQTLKEFGLLTGIIQVVNIEHRRIEVIRDLRQAILEMSKEWRIIQSPFRAVLFGEETGCSQFIPGRNGSDLKVPLLQR